MSTQDELLRPTPRAPPGTVFLPRDAWRPYEKLKKFSLRNGDPSDAESLLIKATIAPSFHWIPIMDLNPNDGIDAIDGYIRSHLAYLTIHNPANWAPAMIRKAAIILGVIRAVSTSYYQLTTGDMIPGEVARPLLRAITDADGTVNYTLAPQVPENPILSADLDLTAVEKTAVAQLILCGAGVIPMQGFSLIMHNHHYLSDPTTQSRKCFMAVEKAYWRAPDAVEWFNSDLPMVQDMAWHKSCHPVQISIKTSVAMSPELPVALRAIGAGACASRLPAVESEMRAAGSYIQCLSTVKPLLNIYGGDVEFSALVNATEMVKAYPPGVLNPTQIQNVPPNVPALVTNRLTAIAHLASLINRSADTVAFCYGFYCAMVDQNQTLGGGSGGESLKASNSLSKLQNQSYASYVGGQQAYGDYAAARNAMRAAGTYNAPRFELQ